MMQSTAKTKNQKSCFLIIKYVILTFFIENTIELCKY